MRMIVAVAMVGWFATSNATRALDIQCSDAECSNYPTIQAEKDACVDAESARFLGRGSIPIAKNIADRCLSDFLKKHFPSFTLADVKKAVAGAPNGVLIDLTSSVPGILDAGEGGFMTLRAEQNLDCRTVHPGGTEIICNQPIDKKWMNENWPWWQREFGGTREAYDQFQLKTMLADQERRRKLIEIAAKQK